MADAQWPEGWTGWHRKWSGADIDYRDGPHGLVAERSTLPLEPDRWTGKIHDGTEDGFAVDLDGCASPEDVDRILSAVARELEGEG